MKQLHYTGKSEVHTNIIFTELVADKGYKFLTQDSAISVEKICFPSDTYKQQQAFLSSLTVVRDWRESGNHEVNLNDGKKLNNWLKKHKYDKIES